MKISVVTACFNTIRTIEATLDSVASQTFGPMEHVVVDGASTDGTWRVIKGRYDTLAVAISEPDRGIYDALNKGIARCSGEVIGFLHADDVYADADVLGRVAQAFQDPTVQAAYGDLDYVSRDEPSRVIRHWQSEPFSRRKLAWGWMPPHPTLYVRRDMYARVGGFDTSYRIAADYDMILRLFSQSDLNPVYIPSVLVRMRLGGASNRSLRNIARKSLDDWRALRNNRVGGAGALFWKNVSKLGQFL